ncbi:MAG: hypothetical protein R3E08_04510 [Thiotrichaceae bacterium]
MARFQVPPMAHVIDTIVEHTNFKLWNTTDLMLEQGLNSECAKDVHCIGTIFRHANEYTFRAHHRLKLLRTLGPVEVCDCLQ